MNPNDRLRQLHYEYKKNNNLNFVGFFDGSYDTPEESTFSNFQQAYFTVEVVTDIKTGKKESIKFSSSEQYFMYLKAFYFKDSNTMKEIIKSGKSSDDYKFLGREIKNFNKNCWDAVSYDFMLEALSFKYTQNIDLLNILLNTEDAIIVEASPYDKIWGIGLGKYVNNGKTHSEWDNPLKWKGLNLLGFALMDLRDSIKLEQQQKIKGADLFEKRT